MNTNATYPQFETLGYFEELIKTLPVGSTGQCIGTRNVAGPEWTPDRECGFKGRRSVCFMEPFTVSKGMKTVTIKASESKPWRGVSMLQRTCGRVVKASK
jgi:hypothetical protein